MGFSWIVSILGSYITDLVISRQTVTTTTARKVANTLATLGPGLSLLGAAFSGCDKTVNVCLLSLAMGFNGFIYSGEQSVMLDIANNFAGTLMGIINSLGNTMGFISPMITGLLTKQHNDKAHWRILFCIASGVYLIGTITFIVLGTAKEQKWNRRPS